MMYLPIHREVGAAAHAHEACFSLHEGDSSLVNPEGIFRVEYRWPIGGTFLTGTVEMKLANGTAGGENADLVLSGTYTLSPADVLELRMGARLAQAGANAQPIPFWLEGKML